MSSGERWRLGHRPGLDGLRGVAILLVLLSHGSVPGLAAAGNTGVTVFFVLSGFLIATLLLEEADRSGRINVTAFYRRRVRRLLPALFAMVAVVALLSLLVPGYTDRGMVLGSLLYFGNWVRAGGDPGAGALGHTWSLSIEEQFYLVAPFVVIALRRRPRLLLGLCATGAVGSMLLRYAMSGGTGYRAYFGTDTRLDGLLIGVGLAVLMRRQLRYSPTLAMAGAGALVGCALVPIGHRTVELVAMPFVASTAAALVLLYAVGSGRWLTSPPLTWVGRRSYGIYLWHYPVVVLVARFQPSWPVRLCVVLGVTWVLAVLSWRFIERPFLERKPAQPKGWIAVPSHQPDAAQSMDWIVVPSHQPEVSVRTV